MVLGQPVLTLTLKSSTPGRAVPLVPVGKSVV